MTDERYKQLMEQVGMPNSRSLLVLLQQVANEVAQEAAAAERKACADLCTEVWTGATNEHPTWLRNAYSHGCLASREAIRMRSSVIKEVRLHDAT